MRSVTLAGLLGTMAAVACLLFVLCGSALAAGPGAAWSVHSFATPSEFSAADTAACTSEPNAFPCDGYQVTAVDVGSAAMDGSPITLTDVLPAGVTAQKVEFRWSGWPFGGSAAELGEFLCSNVAGSVVCRLPTAEFGLPPVAPDDTLEMRIHVGVETGSPGTLTNTAKVSGGGVQEASVSVQNPVNTVPALFGLSGFDAPILGIDGAPDTQAGDHPYEYRTRIDLNNAIRVPPDTWIGNFRSTSVRDVKDVVVDLPLGFVGSALSAPECTLAQLASEQHCPAATVVGRITTEPNTAASVESPVYNIVPERGVAAQFGFYDATRGSHVLDVSVVPTPRGYALRTTSADIPQISLTDVEAVIFGDPVARDGSGGSPVATFTNPAACAGEPLTSVIHMDSWPDAGRIGADGMPDFSDPAWASGSSQAPPVTGCNRLRFEPSLSVRPDTAAADTPAGLDAVLRVPQNQEPGSLATPPLRDATVTLPAGLTVNPAAAGGLGTCTEAQIGLGSAAPPACPESSKVGTVEVSTPALAGTLTGVIYLATQNENPFHALLAGYVVIDDPATGVLVKIPGDLSPDPATGQIRGVFRDSPQFPFSELKLHFFGGARGELATPAGCGTFTTMSDLMPWSAPDSGPDATPSDSFPIDSGCVSGFDPAFTALSENPQAGGYSPFALSIARHDGEQNLAGVTVTLPPGLLGKIAGIPLCPDAQANAGTCPEASRVGSVTAGAGVGPNPYYVSGSAYLTGPYNGGPYGLVEQVPAVAGPFNLGMVSVRQSLRIDPHTAQVTAVSDPLPTILQGIPLRVRRVDVTLDRPGFTFNPTSCTPMQIAGTVTSTQGASANVSSRFQVGGCRELPFKPVFKVSTKAKASKQNGASLAVNVTSGVGQANIGKVAVTLPKALPSRLTTIQQACPEATFNQNPASCPAGSNIGTATAHTPVLSSPVVGPAYLVSHGGAAFPDLVIILQGEGVTLDLIGSIDIKHAVTSSAFDTIPDAPITSFVLSLPQGPHSALAATLPAKAKGSLCGTALVMPTTITGQNGAQIKQNTKIAVTGCGKAKPKKKAKKHRKGKRGK